MTRYESAKEIYAKYGIDTDAAIAKSALQKALSDDVNDTYNMISVDGDTSTNDTVLLLANGLAGNEKITEKNADYEAFCEALNAINTTLARKIAGDGEGFCIKAGVGVGECRIADTLAKGVQRRFGQRCHPLKRLIFRMLIAYT